MIASSSSSSSSFMTSSRGRPSNSAQPYVSPLDSTWTSTSGTSGVSALTSQSSAVQSPNLRPLDLGPPGYEATIVLYENTSREKTVYLGPWEIVGSQNRRVVWQCTYRHERLEHYIPAGDIFPHTLHARHRPYSDPADIERYLTFREPHRIKYTGEDGAVAYDGVVQVRYEFTTVDSSIRFQGEVRGKALLEYYDVDVVWSDVNSRNDRFGSARGMGLVQRIKMWKDNYSSLHSVTVFANRSSRRYHEYYVYLFEQELRSQDDRSKQLRLNVRRRRDTNSSDAGRRFSFTRMRPRQRSGGSSSHGESSRGSSSRGESSRGESSRGSSSRGSTQQGLDIRYLGVQFSHRDDYRRFLRAWTYAHTADREFQGIPFPQHRAELESPQIQPALAELDGGLDPVLESDSDEPSDEDDSDDGDIARSP